MMMSCLERIFVEGENIYGEVFLVAMEKGAPDKT